jgi:hypothetical protein
MLVFEKESMMRCLRLVLVALAIPCAVFAHVTPNVTLVRRGDFAKGALPNAANLFEETVRLSPQDRVSVERTTPWSPDAEETKIYGGRDSAGRLVGRLIFLWLPSQHGPVAIATAFGADGTLQKTAVTDVGTEPLAWVRPLLSDGMVSGFSGLALDAEPDASRIVPEGAGTMTKYYAGVIAEGVRRAQALERVLEHVGH